jgi:hypothetical protein
MIIAPAANSLAMVSMGNGAVAIPNTADVEILRTSATEERTSQTLGRNPNKCWRP